MGIFSALTLARAAERAQTQRLKEPPIATPFGARTLERIVLADMAGIDPPRSITREEAMTIPAVVKARALITGTLARQPLAQWADKEKIDAPAWLYRSDTQQSPITRLTWTLDDLLFFGRSLWAVARDDAGSITDAVRVPIGWWELSEMGDVLVTFDATEKTEVPEKSVILFEGMQEGLLDIASRSLHGAIDIERAWADRVNSPIPMVELHEAERDTEIDDDEAAELVAKWEAARRRSGTAFTPYGIEARMHGDRATDLFIEGRNATRLDVALFTNLPGALLEGSQATATLTYSTQEGQRNELVDYSLSYWALPIEARLSLDDVTPPGTRIAFDIEYFTSSRQPDQFPAMKD